MENKSRRELMALLGGAAVAATLLSKTREASADPPKGRQYMNVTIAVAAGNDALLQKVSSAIQQALGNNVAIGGVGKVSDGWDQTGGWVQDVAGGWSQTGGWYLSNNLGAITKLTGSEVTKLTTSDTAATSKSLVNVRTALKAVQTEKLNTAP